MKNKLGVVDFFSGCGGTSLGLAKSGMEILAGIDNDPDAAASYRRNVRARAFIQEDIRSLPVTVLAPFLKSARQPIVFSGCAPCQPFSKQNRQVEPDDPRRYLLDEFGRFVRHWMPDYVLVENVPGMQYVDDAESPLSGFTSLLGKLGYSFVRGVLPALWFGVPQLRERLIVIASRRPGIRLPLATHGGKKRPVATVRDFIGDLAPLRAGEVDARDQDHRAAGLSRLNLRRIAATPEGGGRESWPRSLWLDCHKDHTGHTDVYGRLSWDKPASGLTTRCISYSNGRFGHPEQNRAISIREAACLQTFPMSYRFSGSYESKARQIGNAVPPLMAKQIGKAILAHARSAG